MEWIKQNKWVIIIAIVVVGVLLGGGADMLSGPVNIYKLDDFKIGKQGFYPFFSAFNNDKLFCQHLT